MVVCSNSAFPRAGYSLMQVKELLRRFTEKLDRLWSRSATSLLLRVFYIELDSQAQIEATHLVLVPAGHPLM